MHRIIRTHGRSGFLPGLAFAGFCETAVGVARILGSGNGGGGGRTTRASFGMLGFRVEVVEAVDAAAGLLAADVDV